MVNFNEVKLLLTFVFVLIYGLSLLFSLPKIFNIKGEFLMNPSQVSRWLILRFAFLIPVFLLQTI